MSLDAMRQELLGIPGTNFGLVTTKINEALAAIQNENVWSFQLKEGGWLTPGLLGLPPVTIGYGQGGFGQGVYGGSTTDGGLTTPFLSPGLMTVSPYTNTVTGDALATAAWTGATMPLITQQQIRVPYYSLYNIIALGNNGNVAYATVIDPGWAQTPGNYLVPVIDLSGPGTGAFLSVVVSANGTVDDPITLLSAGSGYVAPQATLIAGGTPAAILPTLIATLTLDRPWMEPPQVNAAYMIYQAYFAAPKGFKRWFNIRDTTNNFYMDWWTLTQIDLSERDAQRINFAQPTDVVAYGMDTRPGSATLGQMLYELWPHPIMQLPYSFACETNWPDLQNPFDLVPFPLNDEIVKLRAYEMLYLWKESQRGDEMERGSGANWQFLSQGMRAEYTDRLKRIRLMDRNLVDLYFTKMRNFMSSTSRQVYGTVTGQASVGGWSS